MRRATAWVAAVLLAAGCGGGGAGSPTSPSPAPSPSSGDSSKLVVLDPSSFDALVLASPRPSLVEFHLPT